jgi:hypothetical protein
VSSWRSFSSVPAFGGIPAERAAGLRHQGRDGRGPQTKEKTMSHTLIPTSEIEDLCEEALQSKFCALRNDLLRAEGMRTMALASLQTVQTELNRKRALKSRYPAPRC